MKKSAFLISAALLLSGCATVGSGQFSCSGVEAGASCVRSSDLYNEVDKRDYSPDGSPSKEETTNRRRSGDSLGRTYSGEPRKNDDTRSGRSGDRYFGAAPIVPATEPDQLFILNPPKADGTQPVRRSAQAREVWIAPWVDKDDVYHSEQRMSFDISPSTWKNGEDVSSGSPIFNPLK